MTIKEPSENTSKIYRQILKGVKKNETDISLTKKESLIWDKIESEIKEARQKNCPRNFPVAFSPCQC